MSAFTSILSRTPKWLKPKPIAAQDWEARAHLDLKAPHLLGEWFEEQAALAWLEHQPFGPGA